MKKIFILGITTLIVLSCNAQILPMEQAYVYYENDEIGLPENITYVKDVNHILDKYVGVWIGSYQNKTYELRIMKHTLEGSYGLLEDILLLRYIIKDNNTNAVLVDTTNLPNENGKVVKGLYLAEDGIYKLFYNGMESLCGQQGTMYLAIIPPDYTTLKMFIYPDSELINSIDCPNGEVDQVMPLNFMTLIKQ